MRSARRRKDASLLDSVRSVHGNAWLSDPAGVRRGSPLVRGPSLEFGARQAGGWWTHGLPPHSEIVTLRPHTSRHAALAGTGCRFSIAVIGGAVTVLGTLPALLGTKPGHRGRGPGGRRARDRRPSTCRSAPAGRAPRFTGGQARPAARTPGGLDGPAASTDQTSPSTSSSSPLGREGRLVEQRGAAAGRGTPGWPIDRRPRRPGLRRSAASSPTSSGPTSPSLCPLWFTSPLPPLKLRPPPAPVDRRPRAGAPLPIGRHSHQEER